MPSISWTWPWQRTSTLEELPALTAAASAMKQGQLRLLPQYENWQHEAWEFYDKLGELRFGIQWLANALSRVRLRAGKLVVGQDEPQLVNNGPAAEIIDELGSIGEQSELLKRLATLLSVPGECFLIGEDTIDGENWFIRSLDELRRDRQSDGYEVIDDGDSRNNQPTWRPLADAAFITRLWRPHARYNYMADSPVRAARPKLRELELVNRNIIAHYYSRIASAGVLMLPEELTFPVREEFNDAADPFVAEWIATAKEAIKTPGTAAAVVPIPIRAPGEYIEKVKFIDFTTMMDEKIIEKRESAIKGLASDMDLPAEVMLGMGDVNHWSAWQLDEAAIKMHIAPIAELICDCLTKSYLHPRLKAEGKNIARWVVWYDTSELALRPDRSTQATEAYANFEISPEAYRRELGFDEADAPTEDQLRDMMLKGLAKEPTTGFQAIGDLLGRDAVKVGLPTMSPKVTGGEAPAMPNAPENPAAKGDEPSTKEKAPPPPDEGKQKATALIRLPLTIERLRRHRIEIDFSGQWTVLHPITCGNGKVHECPVTWAAYEAPFIAPGTSGKYELTLIDGKLALGQRALNDDDSLQIKSRVK